MNDIIQDFTQTLNKSQSEVSAAWDLAKEQALSKYKDSDEEYFPYVVSLTKQYLNQGQEDNKVKMGGQKTSIFSDPPQNSSYTPRTNQQESVYNPDYFDWKNSSTTKKAEVKFLILDKLYQMTFTYMREGQSLWSYEWQPLLKQGINSIVSVTIEQLNGNINNQKISINKNNINIERKEEVYKAMLLAFEEYLKTYNKARDIQYFIFTTETEFRFNFIKEFIAKYLCKKYPKYSDMEEVAKSISRLPLRKVIAVKNSSAKLKEDDFSGTVSSSSFDAAPFDAGRKRADWKKDWDSQKPKKKNKKKEKKIRIINLSLAD